MSSEFIDLAKVCGGRSVEQTQKALSAVFTEIATVQLGTIEKSQLVSKQTEMRKRDPELVRCLRSASQC
jgi:hypothetical protein